MRICSGPGCLRAVDDAVKLCDECKPASQPTSDDTRNHTSRYDAELDKLRKGARWQRIRKLAVQRQPVCARCDIALTEIVDHVIPAREALGQCRASGAYLDRNAGYYLVSNLQGLCRPCHWVKTNDDKTHTGPWPDVVEAERAAPKRRYSF